MSTLVIGEALIDVVRHVGSDETTSHPGGSPLNVAVGLARLGRTASLLTTIGEDPLGEILREQLEGTGVNLVPGSLSASPTSVANALVDDDGKATYDFALNWDPVGPPSDPDERAALKADAPRAVHIGSISAHLQPGATAVREWVEFYRDVATITYDPNVRLQVVGPAEKLREEVAELAPLLDVVKASDEDLEALFGTPDARSGADFFLSRGASLVVVTLGAAGLRMFTPHNEIVVPAVKVEVADTVGAGDALMAALIDGMGRISVLGGEDRSRVADLSPTMLGTLGSYAAAAAAITCTRHGAHPPTRSEISAASDLYTSTENYAADARF